VPPCPLLLRWGLAIFLPGLSQTVILLIFASQVTEIAGMSLPTQNSSSFLLFRGWTQSLALAS
jgi:hypothetical protein